MTERPDAGATVSATPAPKVYLVRVTTRNGAYSVGWDDPARVLQAIAEFHASGFGQVAVYDIAGRKIDFATIEAAAARAAET